MNKHKTVKLTIVLVMAMMAFFALRASAGQIEGARGALRQLTGLVVPRADRADRQLTDVAAPALDHALPATPRVIPLSGDHLAMANLASAGQVVTQTFTLHAGWNTIYLEVEPANPSPLVGVGLQFGMGWSLLPFPQQMHAHSPTFSAASRTRAASKSGSSANAASYIPLASSTRPSWR